MSTLFTAIYTGFSVLCSILAISLSASVKPVFESTTKMNASASSISFSICFLINGANLSSSVSIYPPVSTSSKGIFLHSVVCISLSLVIPGMSSTIAFFCPIILLNSEDFPTFGLPTIATLYIFIPLCLFIFAFDKFMLIFYIFKLEYIYTRRK